MNPPPRYQPLAVEQHGTRKVARVRSLANGETLTFYRRKNRILYLATDASCRDERLRRLVKEMLA